jgi:hypothetical protein
MPTQLEERLRRYGELFERAIVTDARPELDRTRGHVPVHRWRLIAALGGAAVVLATVGGLVVAAIVVSRDDGSNTVTATGKNGEVDAVSFEFETVPAGYDEARPEGTRRVVCERWRLDGDGPVCQALAGATGVRYTSSAGMISVTTAYGQTLAGALRPRDELPPDLEVTVTPTRVRGHEARRLSFAGTAPGTDSELLAWEESPGVVVSVTVERYGAEPPAEPPDVRALAENVAARALPEPLEYVVARGDVPFPIPGPGGSPRTYRWFITTSLGDDRDRCARLYITLDPAKEGLDPTGECVVVPPRGPVRLLTDPNDGGFDEGDDTVLLVGVVRRDVASLQVVAGGEEMAADLIESPADRGYRFFAAQVGADTPAVLRPYDDTGQQLGQIEPLAP